MANWRGAWDSGTAYAAGDSVSYGGVSYYCVTANTGQAPGTGADWALLDTFKGAQSVTAETTRAETAETAETTRAGAAEAVLALTATYLLRMTTA